ncbi:MAG: choice-of-anchor Q domain-containing protein [Panacagrimonas sp.]
MSRQCTVRTSAAFPLQKRSALALAATALFFSAAPAWAATIEVGVGGCRLAQAIDNANGDADTDGSAGCVAGSGADHIVLPASSTLTLTAALPDISSEITIEGGGATLKRRRGAERFRILKVTATGTLTLKDTIVTGGHAPDGSFPASTGGGIYVNGGVLTLTGCTVSGNTASDGGGLINIRGGTSTVLRSTISGNRSSFGGGVYNGSNVFNGPRTTLAVIDSTISGNDGGRFGGGLWNNGSARLIRSRMVDNRADAGAGVFTQSDNASLSLRRSVVSANRGTGLFVRGNATLSDSTISNNLSTGVVHANGTLELTNSTISGNGYGGLSAYDGDGVVTLTNCTVSGNSSGGAGGGIQANRGSVTLINSTVSNNRAAAGGGIFSRDGTTTLVRSLISGNSATVGPELLQGDRGAIVADRRNLVGSYDYAGTLGVTLGSTDIVPSVPSAAILNPLAKNGGRTRTHALVTGSPAIDAAGPDCPSTDQRRATRPVGVACDIGVFEGDLPPPDLPSLSIEDASVVEGTHSRRETRLRFTVSLSAVATREDVFASFDISDGTTMADSDYRVIDDGFVFIPVGTRRLGVTVFVKADGLAEAAETLTVTLRDPTGATIADGEAVGTIIDDD